MATVDYRPARLNRRGRTGDTVADVITINEAGVPANLTGRGFTAQLRRKPTDDAAISIEVDTADAASGTIILRLGADVTEELSGAYVWDLQQVTGGVVRTLVGGTWTFDYDVTRTN